MHHAVIFDSEVEVITSAPALRSFLPASVRPAPQRDALMSAIDLVAGDNSFHRSDTP